MGHACWGSGGCETFETGVIGVVELERGFEGSLVENGVWNAEVGKWWLRKQERSLETRGKFILNKCWEKMSFLLDFRQKCLKGSLKMRVWISFKVKYAGFETAKGAFLTKWWSLRPKMSGFVFRIKNQIKSNAIHSPFLSQLTARNAIFHAFKNKPKHKGQK